MACREGRGEGSSVKICTLPPFSRCGWRAGELAGMLGVNRRTFERLVKKSLERPCNAWLREIRAVKAMNLLRCGSTVAEVAAVVVFGDASAFSREFRRTVGVCPKLYQTKERARSPMFQTAPNTLCGI